MSKRIKCLLTAGVLCISLLIGSMHVKADELEWDKLGQVIYNSTNGLMSNNVSSIEQTNDGIVWIGTDKGLVAFDGNEFAEYGSFYYFDGVTDMTLTRSGSIWYATTTYGGAVNLETRFHHFDDIGMKGSNYATSIAESTDGRIYVGTIRHMYSVAPNEGYVVSDLMDNGIHYATSLAAGDNNLIAGTTINGEVFFMENGQVIKTVDGGFKGKAATAYWNGCFLIGTPDGEIIVYSAYNDFEEELRMVVPLGDSAINNFFVENGERIWVLAEDGMGYYELPKVDLTSSIIYAAKEVLADAEFVECSFKDFESGYTDMMKDYQGNYWISSSKRGVLLVRNSDFVDEFAQIDIDMDTVNAVAQKDNYLYVATDSELMILDQSNKELISNEITEALIDKRVVDCVIYNDGLLAAVYGEGVYVFEDSELTEILSDELISRQINGLELVDGQLYVLTDGGAVIYDKSGECITYTVEDGMYNPKITCVIKGAFGRQTEERTYFGSQGAGIYVYKDGGLELCIDENYGIESKNVNDMLCHDKGFFIATDSGISYYNGKKIVEFTELPEELMESVCRELYIVDDYLYVVCENALYIISLEDLFDGVESDTLEYSFFDENAGFLSPTTPGGHNYLSEGGTLYLACTDRVYSIEKSLNESNVADFKLMLRSVKADGVSVELVAVSEEENKYQVTVESDIEEVQLLFSVLEFSNEDPYVQYIMHGVDTEANVIRHSELEELVYEGLKGGSHEFWFDLLDENGETIERITLTIIKEKSIFENLWVRMLGLAGGFAILMYFVFKDKKH